MDQNKRAIRHHATTQHEISSGDVALLLYQNLSLSFDFFEALQGRFDPYAPRDLVFFPSAQKRKIKIYNITPYIDCDLYLIYVSIKIQKDKFQVYDV